MKNRFNILALSGGGFRGLYTTTVLARLEQIAQKPIAQCFDLICGTSIGGILAMALALEIRTSEIMDIMEKSGPEIFSDGRTIFSNFFRPKYDNRQLKRIVYDSLFGDHLLGDSCCRLLIPTFNYSSGKPQFFKTPHCKSLNEDHKKRMSEVAMMTSAAPVYFPIYQSKESNSCYVDGGLVGNAPGLFGVHEAQFFCGQNIDSIYLLAIGTMGSEYRMDVGKSLKKGILNWRENLLHLTLSAQETTTNFMLRHQLEERYFLIDDVPTHEQEKHIGFDISTTASVQILKSMGEESAKKFIGLSESGDFLSHVAQPFTQF